MSDLNTGLGILGAAIGSAKIVEKVLGPTAEYLGNGLKNWTEKRVQSFARIIKKSSKLLDENKGLESAVNPRILKEVVTEGTNFENDLAEEYYAGVLASSRRGYTIDDRGAVLLKKLAACLPFKFEHIIFFIVH